MVDCLRRHLCYTMELLQWNCLVPMCGLHIEGVWQHLCVRQVSVLQLYRVPALPFRSWTFLVAPCLLWESPVPQLTWG